MMLQLLCSRLLCPPSSVSLAEKLAKQGAKVISRRLTVLPWVVVAVVVVVQI